MVGAVTSRRTKVAAGSRRRPIQRVRRSHAVRRAETRARIIAAVTEAIAEVGFQRTTAAEIVQRAGVTWGAVQHHFGGKDGTLLAVLEHSFARFAERVGAVDVRKPIEKRVGDFVDRAWEHFDSAHYRSTLEILLHYSGQSERGSESWQGAMESALDATWGDVFGDSGLSPQRRAALQRYTIAVLTGLASMRFIGGDAAATPRNELQLLKQTLTRELRGH